MYRPFVVFAPVLALCPFYPGRGQSAAVKAMNDVMARVVWFNAGMPRVADDAENDG